MVVAILVNTCLNTYWLTVMYGNSFVALLPARLLKQLVMVPVEAVLFYLVAKTLAGQKFLLDEIAINISEWRKEDELCRSDICPYVQRHYR